MGILRVLVVVPVARLHVGLVVEAALAAGISVSAVGAMPAAVKLAD
jgi:hypothetical protein